MRACQWIDKAVRLVILCVILSLSSVSFLARRCPAQAASAAPTQVTPASATTFSQTPDIDDGDGDELLEHWGDPKYSTEARLQITGLLVLFVMVGIGSYRRRLTLRRSYGNG